jgi:sortase (surface protein transpeptidase)
VAQQATPSRVPRCCLVRSWRWRTVLGTGARQGTLVQHGAVLLLVIAFALSCGSRQSPSSPGTSSGTPRAARPSMSVTPLPEIASKLAPLKQFQQQHGDPPNVSGRLRIPRIAVDAPITDKDAPPSLDLSNVNPEGPADVVWYNVHTPGFGGEPGKHHNALLAAHVDYNYPVRYAHADYRGPGAFLGVEKLEPNDAIEITLHGATKLYGVVWVKTMREHDDWGSVFASESSDGDGILTLLTCTGDFDPATQEYNARTVVRAKLFE